MNMFSAQPQRYVEVGGTKYAIEDDQTHITLTTMRVDSLPHADVAYNLGQIKAIVQHAKEMGMGDDAPLEFTYDSARMTSSLRFSQRFNLKVVAEVAE